MRGLGRCRSTMHGRFSAHEGARRSRGGASPVGRAAGNRHDVAVFLTALEVSAPCCERRRAFGLPRGSRQNRGAMQDLPSGTVTFLFTDIEGSTRLLRGL